MDWLAGQQRLKTCFQKYKYVLLIVAVGVFLMALPQREEKENSPAPAIQTEAEECVSEQLVQILSQIEGVGKVRVMVTEAVGEETVYQTDENRTEGEHDHSYRCETVTISRNGEEAGLVKTVTPPTYLGAIVVCQGGDSPSVKLAVAQAVSAVTGISTDRITVLKMK